MPQPPRIVILGLNYPPEPTGISPYTGGLAQGLASRGARVQVITSHPHYPEWRIRAGYGEWTRTERHGEVNVKRVRHYVPSRPRNLTRLLSEISFGIRQVLTRWERPDVIVAISPAMVSSAIAALRARLAYRDVPFVIWVQDLYSKGLEETGRADGLGAVLLRRIEGALLRRADAVVAIHDRFATRITSDFAVSPDRVQVVRNWTHLPPAPPFDVNDARADLGWQNGETIVLHAGAIGVKQGLDNVLAAARLAATDGVRVRFVLLGDGSERMRLEAAAGSLPSISFLDPLDDARFAAALRSADVLLVNERPGVAEMAVPSKLTSYFSTGRPVIAATNTHGITADEVRAAGAGVVVPAGDPKALLDAVKALASDPDESARLGALGPEYCAAMLDPAQGIENLARLLDRLVRGRQPTVRRRPPR